MAQQVKLPPGQSGAAFALVGQYCHGNQPQLMNDTTLKDVQMATKSIGKPWTTVSGTGEVLRALASSCRHAAQLLGSDEDTKEQVREWLQFAESEGGAMTNEKLQKLNQHLSTRVHLVGGTLTLADLVVFATAHPAVASFSQEQIQQHVNLVRWFDFIQHTADTAGTHAKVAVAKPALRISAPLPPAAKARCMRPLDKPASKGKDPADERKGAAAVAAVPSGAATANGTADAAAAPEPSAASAEVASDAGSVKQGKKERKEKKDKATKPAAVKAPASITALEIRVGQVVDVQNHPEAEKLYVEKIDLGEGEPRTIVSGLRNFVSLEAMQGRRVVVLANLKPAKLVGITSAGMVLCASNDDHTAVDPISPPEGAAIGERITFEGQEGEPEAQLNPKKKVFEELAPSLRTDASGVAKYQDLAFTTTAGVVTSTIPNASVR